MKYEIDLDYSDALAIFSDEAFYNFAAKIDFNPRELQETDRTPPPLPAASFNSSPPPSEACSCCLACKQQQQQQQQQPQQRYHAQELQYQQFSSQPMTYYVNYDSPYQYVPTTPVAVYTRYESSPSPVKAPRKPVTAPQSSIQLQRTLQNRLIWSRALQKKFLQAVEYFGLDNAMPRGILNFMNSPSVIPGLTRANISSHLQKYRKKVAAKKNRKVEDDDEEFDFGYENLTLEGDHLVC